MINYKKKLKAIKEEKLMLDKVTTKSGYMSAVTNLIKQIRQLLNNDKSDSSGKFF